MDEKMKIGRQRPRFPTPDGAVLARSLGGLASVFGMGTGVPRPLWSPTNRKYSFKFLKSFILRNSLLISKGIENGSL